MELDRFHEYHERVQEKLQNYADIARGIAHIAFQALKDAPKHIIDEPPPYISDHYRNPGESMKANAQVDYVRGGAALLDRELYDQEDQLSFETDNME